MLKIFKILNILLKTRKVFFKPKNYQIIIFDDVNDMFENVLKNRRFISLNVRDYTIDKVYLNHVIILRTFVFFLKNYNKGINLYTSYLISVIEAINPKLVLTGIDNSLKFSEIAKFLYKKINFIAVQNAARYDFDKFSLLYKRKLIKNNFNKKYFLPHYYCFSEFEKKNCKKNKINVNNFYCYGSLKLSNYIHKLKLNKKNIKKKYDVALISEASIGKDLLWKKKGVDNAFAEVAKYTIKFCKDNNLKFVFLSKRPKGKSRQLEFDFYKKYLSDDDYNYLIKYAIKEKNKKEDNYKYLNESKIAVGVCSTMLREKIALGGKIMSCDFTPLKFYNSPFDKRLITKRKNYKVFENKLKKIFRMKNKKYNLIINNQKLINQNSGIPTFQYLNQHINRIITND